MTVHAEERLKRWVSACLKQARQRPSMPTMLSLTG